jgi:hypothetical protein
MDDRWEEGIVMGGAIAEPESVGQACGGAAGDEVHGLVRNDMIWDDVEAHLAATDGCARLRIGWVTNEQKDERDGERGGGWK